MPSSKITFKDKKLLLDTARHAIQYGLLYHQPPKMELNKYPPELCEFGASFVTLKESNQLRGCIGSLKACQPLIQDIADHAFAAAFKDPRFPAVKHIEEPMIHISISLLSTPEPMKFDSQASLIEQLQVGIDGLILNFDDHQATFLPSVWAQLSEPNEFLAHLKVKAGLDANFWDPKIEFSRYHCDIID